MKEQPIKGKEEILNENVIGVNQERLKEHHDFLPSVLKAMEVYKDQFVQSGEERLFTLKEALEIYKAGRICGGAGHFPSDNCEPKYFKEKFNISI